MRGWWVLALVCGCGSESLPGFFEITAPTNNAIGEPYSPTIIWTPSDGADHYSVELAMLVSGTFETVYFSPEVPAYEQSFTVPETDMPPIQASSPVYALTVVATNGAGELRAGPTLFHAGDYPIFAGGDTTFEWKSATCAAGDNDTAINGSLLVVETASNCAGPQVVYFTRPSIDFSSFASGHVTFRVETTVSGQSISFRIGDATTASSPVLNLTGFGFDPSKPTMPQAISIPVAMLSGVDLGEMERVFQVEITCPTTNCFTSLSNIEWTQR